MPAVPAHLIKVPYETDDAQALTDAIAGLEKAGENVLGFQYFCVAPTASFVILTAAGAKKPAAKRAPAKAAAPAKPAAKARTKKTAAAPK